jgi:Ca2+-binding EF-hand superfamily protein
MDNIEWFFNLHDKNKDGFLTKDEVLTVSESLLVCELFLGQDKFPDASV